MGESDEPALPPCGHARQSGEVEGDPRDEVRGAFGVELRVQADVRMRPRLQRVAHVLATALTFVYHSLSLALYVAVALMWLVPDRRVERSLTEAGTASERS